MAEWSALDRGLRQRLVGEALSRLAETVEDGKLRERVQEEMKKTVSAPRAWWEKDFSLGVGGDEQMKRRRGDKWQLTGLKTQKEREMKDNSPRTPSQPQRPRTDCGSPLH